MPDATRPSAPVPSVYQLRVVVRGVSPLIWRRLLVPADTTISGLHAVLQARFAGLVSYGVSADLLNEILPLGRALYATTVRRQGAGHRATPGGRTRRRTTGVHHRLPRRLGRAAPPGSAVGRRPGWRLRPLLHATDPP